MARAIRHLTLLFGLLVAVGAATGQNLTDAKGRKQGPWVRTHDNGTVRYTGQFKDDIPVGTFKHYGTDGALTSVVVHAGDGVTSRTVHHHSGGGVMARGKYIGQAKDSVWNYYDEEGRLRKVERYRSGTLHGERSVYYPNGQLAEREELVEGRLHGPSTSWFDDGKVKTRSTYVQGEPDGAMTFFHPNGTKEIEGNLVNGARHGVWYYYNDDGSLQLQMLYAKGVLKKERKENGLFREHFDDERPKREETYRNGKREGPFKEYHDNGQWMIKPMPADPVSGTPQDMQRVLHGQTVKQEGRYVNDLLEGEVKEYDERGKLVKVRRYVAGVEE
jgi:antitoxin component YwqK of YwqJK toxin-antitoxin module